MFSIWSKIQRHLIHLKVCDLSWNEMSPKLFLTSAFVEGDNFPSYIVRFSSKSCQCCFVWADISGILSIESYGKTIYYLG